LVWANQPANADDKARKKEDEGKAAQILNEIGTANKPAEIRRLGNYQRDAGRPRPLRLSFLTQGARDEVVKAFRQAKRDVATNEEEKLITSVSIRKDLTPTERKQEDALFQELKEKQQQSEAAGDENAKWVRKNGKVVNIGKRPNQLADEGRG
jgi:hypothetical protein